MKQHIGPFPYLFVLFLLLYNACFSSTPTAFVADDSIYHDIFRPSRPLGPAPTTRFDSLTIEQKKNFLRAGIEWFSIQAIPASVNYFIRKDPVANISFKNFFSHLKFSAWTWDDNHFATNQIAHPYHGQFYFNAFRSNNFSFLQSTAATVAGSYIWETAGETEPPSINDIINTSFGGTILGEMTHRLSHHILARPSLTKSQRNKKEILAMLINPINGLNRLLDGRWGNTH